MVFIKIKITLNQNENAISITLLSSIEEWTPIHQHYISLHIIIKTNFSLLSNS